jgi:endonuclease/exonuclease/phosphatase family metal-dependent hydrolase
MRIQDIFDIDSSKLIVMSSGVIGLIMLTFSLYFTDNPWVQISIFSSKLSARMVQHTSKVSAPGCSTKRLRVYTQNVWAHHFATPLGCNNEGAAAPVMPGLPYEARLRALATCISQADYDIICIQELFVLRIWPFVFASNFLLFSGLLRELGYSFCTDPSESLPFYGQNSGVVIFSKYPLSNMKSEVYKHSAEPLNKKGFVCASVALSDPAVNVYIFSIHTDAKNWDAKRKQIEQIKNSILAIKEDKNCNSGNLVDFILAGDFNVCSQTIGCGGFDDGTQYATLVSKMDEAAALKDAWNVNECVATEGDATLDHLFYDPVSWEVLEKEVVRYKEKGTGNSVSDHLGLTFDIKSTRS